MALTAYDGLQPTIASGVIGDKAAFTAVSSRRIPLIPIWKNNDYLVVSVICAANTDPTNIAVYQGAFGSTNYAMTKLFSNAGMGIWILKNPFGADSSNASLVVDYGATSTSIQVTAFLVTNTSGYTYATGNTANVSSGSYYTVGVSDLSVALFPKATSLQVGVVLARQNSTASHIACALTMAGGTNPASLGSLQVNMPIVNSTTAGSAQFVCATQNEYPATAPTSLVNPSNTTTASCFLYMKDSSTGGTDYVGAVLSFQPATISLDDFNFKLDTGPLLNGDSALPFYDVDSVTGLSDLNVTNSSDPIDGTDGSYVSAKFLVGKSVVLSGTAYSTGTAFDESLLDNLKLVAKPKSTSVPFYYKPSGKAPRFLRVYPTGLTSDIDRNRALVKAPFQLQMSSERAASQSLAIQAYTCSAGASAGQFGITPPGNTESHPIIYFTVGTADVGTAFTFFNSTWFTSKYPNALVPSFGDAGTALVVTPTAVGFYKLSFSLRTLSLLTGSGSTDVSNQITTRVWWTLIPQVNNLVTVQGGGSGLNYINLVLPDAWS